MWVNPFWFGVLVTLVVEIVGVLISAIIVANKENEK